ncbi:hypothetical protein R3P38DRAFT_3196542 [Favolaschia claudopus]|uniref:Uncharacterized protein n=1 Tax=Favolaschia claudopus TaxID=2862362 RepID=A0AAW0B7Z2_9AGAR
MNEDSGWPELLAKLHFPNLKRLNTIISRTMQEPFHNAFGRILTLPSLRRLNIHLIPPPSSSFMLAWQYCSPSIQHLSLRCITGFGSTPNKPSSAFIKLKSLEMNYAGDFESKRIGGGNLIPWSIIGTASIQVLELSDYSTFHYSQSLPSFGSRSSKFLPLKLVDTLKTIPSTQRIQLILLVFEESMDMEVWDDSNPTDPNPCAALDQTLASLPLSPLPMVHIKSWAGHEEEDEFESRFPSLVEKKW